MAPVIVCVGLTTIDIAQVVDALPAAGSKITADRAWLDVGGPAANAARVAHREGCQVRLVTALGDSSLAMLARERLDGIEIIDIAPPDHQLPVSTIFITPDGGRTVVSRNAAALESAGSPGAEVLKDVDVVLHDGHLLDASLLLAQNPAPIQVLDGGSWKPGLELLLPLLDVAVVSADFALPGSTPDQALDDLAGFGIPRLARSCGAEPVQAMIGEQLGIFPVPQVEAVDTTGAGDVLHGSLIAQLAGGIDFTAALRNAITQASESVTHYGVL